jgi:hypothetical protein
VRVSSVNILSPIVQLISYKLPTITSITSSNPSGHAACVPVGGNPLKLAQCPRQLDGTVLHLFGTNFGPPGAKVSF